MYLAMNDAIWGVDVTLLNLDTGEFIKGDTWFAMCNSVNMNRHGYIGIYDSFKCVGADLAFVPSGNVYYLGYEYCFKYVGEFARIGLVYSDAADGSSAWRNALRLDFAGGSYVIDDSGIAKGYSGRVFGKPSNMGAFLRGLL